MSSLDKEYYEYLNKLDKEDLITKVMNLESQNNELSNENYELGRENERLKSGEFVSPEVAKQSFEMRDKALKKYEEKLKVYKRALELACDSIRDMYCSDYCVSTRDERCNGKCCYEKYYNKEQFLDQAKKELEEQND